MFLESLQLKDQNPHQGDVYCFGKSISSSFTLSFEDRQGWLLVYCLQGLG